MKKSRKPAKRRKAQPAKAAAVTPTRRSFLANAPYALGAVILVGGLGFFGVSTLRADLAEQDLSNIGNGIPAIVQVHDPTCPVCIALEKETRAAFNDIDDTDLAYRVASLTSDTGSAFAAQHTAGYATLLFFDGAGQLTNRLQGENTRAALETAFLAHINNDR